MNQINRHNSFHESIGMYALWVPLDLVLFLLITSICFFVPHQVPPWTAKLWSNALKLRGSSECVYTVSESHPSQIIDILG